MLATLYRRKLVSFGLILFVFSQAANSLEAIKFQNTLDAENNAFLSVTDRTFSSYNYSVFVHDGTLIYDDYPNSNYRVPVEPEEGAEEVDLCLSSNPKLYTHPQNSLSNCQNISLATQRLELSQKSNTSFTLCRMNVGANHLELNDVTIELIGRKVGQADQTQTLIFSPQSANGYYQTLNIQHSDDENSEFFWNGDFTSIFVSVNKSDAQPGILYFDDLVFSATSAGCL